MPEKDGTPLSAVGGLDADALVADAWDLCDREQGGWVNYTITNPVTGAVQGKSSYVMEWRKRKRESKIDSAESRPIERYKAISS